MRPPYSNRVSVVFAVSMVWALSIGSALAQGPNEWRRLARDLVEQEVAAAGVANQAVLDAVRTTPRHEFVPLAQRRNAYYDMALPIGGEQTISPPFVVAYMTEQLDPQPGDKVLEIGTGSGYQAAILSQLVREVYTIEIVPSLANSAGRTLKRLKYRNVHTRMGDGFAGWPEAAPFDKIMVTCSPEQVPQPLVDQLREGGRMVVPEGQRYHQNLYLLTKKNGELEREPLRATFFVPMTGAAEAGRQVQPDPEHPRIENGSFEEQIGKTAEPSGWHYFRLARLVTDPTTAVLGHRYVVFSSKEPGRVSHALQGFAIDGRKVELLQVSLTARGTQLRPGPDRSELPGLVITFYDQKRLAIAMERLPVDFGDYDWQPYAAQLAVPAKAREAIVRIGLQGGTGELGIDRLSVSRSGE